MTQQPKSKVRELCPTAAWLNNHIYQQLIGCAATKARIRIELRNRKR